MKSILSGGFWLASLAFLALVVPGQPADAARPRGPSAAQMKKMQEQMQYARQELLRYQNETAAKEREVYLSCDENGNDKLEGSEKAKYDKYCNEVRKGKVSNPFAGIAPPGQGPKAAASRK
jgi:hypothetical protein